MNAITKSLLIAAIGTTLPAVGFGAVITVRASTLVATQSSTIRSDTPTTTASSPNILWAGTLSGGADLRSVFTFNLSSFSLGVGESISSVTLDLTYRAPDPSATVGFMDVGIYHLTQAYTGQQVSWNNSATSTPWSTAGGTFDATQLSLSNVQTGTGTPTDTLVPQFGSTTAFKNAVTSAAGTSFQLLLLAPTQESATNRQFANFYGYSATAAQLPTLTITTVPEPATWMLLAGSLTVVVIFRRRRA